MHVRKGILRSSVADALYDGGVFGLGGIKNAGIAKAVLAHAMNSNCVKDVYFS